MKKITLILLLLYTGLLIANSKNVKETAREFLSFLLPAQTEVVADTAS